MGALVVLWLCLLGLASSQTSSLQGEGSVGFSNVISLYTLVDSTTKITYSEASYSQAVGRFEQNQFDQSHIDFLISQAPLTPAEHTKSDCSGVYDIHEFPLSVDGLVLIYTIPGVDTLNPSTPTLILDRQTIVDIYSGDITQWNDPQIVALNPLLASSLPAVTIKPYYIEDSSMSTLFSQALSSFSSVWASAAQTAGPTGWPFIATKINNEDGNGPERMQALVLAGSSIGFVQYSASRTLNNVARVVNKNGNTLAPSVSNLNAAVNDHLDALLSALNLVNADPVTHPAQVELSIVDGPGANAWPFAHFNMLTTRTNSNQDCLQAKSLYNFLLWLLTSPSVANLWGQQSMGLLRPEMVSVLTAVVGRMTCCQNVAGGGQTKTHITGSGTEFDSVSLGKLSDLYATLFPYDVDYIFAPVSAALQSVANDAKDFALTVSLPNNPSQYTVPLLGGAVVPIYNMPEGLEVVLTVSLLESIFLGSLTTWADIDPSFPNRLITPILRTDPDIASIFMVAAGNIGIPFVSSSQEDTVARVVGTADSIGLAVLAEDTHTWGVQIASMINLGGQRVASNLTTLANALKSQADFKTSPINVADPGSWPLSAYSYITFQVDAGSYCPAVQNLAQFIYWMYTDPSAASSAQSSLVAIPPFSAEVAEYLKGITCDNKPILNPRLIIPGAGSTFAAGVYQSWINAYAFIDAAAEFTYAGVGSGAGIRDITDGTVVWAGSDAPLTEAQATAAPDLQLYPAFAGSVVLAYRIDTLPSNSPPLNLTREVIVDIYLGNIQMWNHPAIVALNPAVASVLPNANIQLVYRSDSSGTTNIFSTALQAFDPVKWTVKPGTTVQWPVTGITGSGSAGLGLRIFSTSNSLGYVELSYAAANGLAYATLKNKAGFLVTPTQRSVQSAMNDFKDSFTPQLICTIVDGPGENSWPIAAYTYLVLHTKTMADLTTAQKMLSFIQWGLTSDVASTIADQLGFVTLPSSFVETIIMPKLREVAVNGKSVLGLEQTTDDSDDSNLGLALGVGLGAGVPLVLFVLFVVYCNKRRMVGEKEDAAPVEATEWDDMEVKASELPTYNDALGITIGNGSQELLKFGLAKGIRFPVGHLLTDRFVITNTSATDKNFAFFIPKDDSRFRLVLTPGMGVIRAGEVVPVEVKFTLLMTTGIARKIKFEVAGVGAIAIPLNISGDVSTRLDPNEIDIMGKPIGQGAFGTVYRGSYRGTAVAVKVLARQNELLKAQTDEFMKEIDLMHKLRSPYIVNFIGASYVPGKLCVVTEFMEKGSVAYVLQRIKLEHVLRLKIAYDCAQAMAFLHNNGVMHRDLKPANLLVLSLSSSAEVSVKLADFGTSRTVTQIYHNGRHTNGWGTPGYMAPELLARGEYSGKVDVYAFGILLLELYTQKDPFSFLKKVWDLPDIILRGNRPEIPADCPPDYADIIAECWSQLPESRPSFPDLVATLEPMYREERVRAKENKARRVAETISAGTPPDGSVGGGYTGGPSLSNSASLNPSLNPSLNTHSNNPASLSPYSNNPSSSLNPLNRSNPSPSNPSPYVIRISNASSDGEERRRGPSVTKGKEKLAGSDGFTTLANLSHDNIDQDRRDMFESERDKM